MGIGRSRRLEDKIKVENNLILHKLILNGRYMELSLALELIKYNVEQIQGMSLYHTFVISVVHNHLDVYPVEHMFNVLREYKSIIGYGTEPSNGFKNIMIYSQNPIHPRKKIITLSFVNSDGTHPTGFLDEQIVKSDQCITSQYMLPGLSPLMLALNIKRDTLSLDSLDFVIELLCKIEREQCRI